MSSIKQILEFLDVLKKNNNREWFHTNKKWYLEVKDFFELYVSGVIMEVHQIDPQVPLLPASECIFRIHRDTRFSADKTPYKTNMGAFITKGGRKSLFGGYYLHLEPGACMLAGGIYMPDPGVLRSIRTDVYENYREFREITSAPAFRKHFGSISGDRLVRPPKGFPEDFEGIEDLKYKDYTVAKNIPCQMAVSGVFIREIREVFEAMVPLNHFLNAAVEHHH